MDRLFFFSLYKTKSEIKGNEKRKRNKSFRGSNSDSASRRTTQLTVVLTWHVPRCLIVTYCYTQ